MYDASTLRWTTRDPLEFKAGQPNLYEYVGNDPLDKTDPSGEIWSWAFAAAGAAVGAVVGASIAAGSALLEGKELTDAHVLADIGTAAGAGALAGGIFGGLVGAVTGDPTAALGTFALAGALSGAAGGAFFGFSNTTAHEAIEHGSDLGSYNLRKIGTNTGIGLVAGAAGGAVAGVGSALVLGAVTTAGLAAPGALSLGGLSVPGALSLAAGSTVVGALGGMVSGSISGGLHALANGGSAEDIVHGIEEGGRRGGLEGAAGGFLSTVAGVPAYKVASRYSAARSSAPPAAPARESPGARTAEATAAVEGTTGQTSAPARTQTVYTLGDVPVDVNRLPQAVPANQKVIPSRAYGGTYVVEANPLTMTPQEFHAFVSNNLPAIPFPKRLTVIEVPEGGVKVDPSVLKPEPGTGHIPPNSGARVTATYDITYDQWGNPTFKKVE